MLTAEFHILMINLLSRSNFLSSGQKKRGEGWFQNFSLKRTQGLLGKKFIYAPNKLFKNSVTPFKSINLRNKWNRFKQYSKKILTIVTTLYSWHEVFLLKWLTSMFTEFLAQGNKWSCTIAWNDQIYSNQNAVACLLVFRGAHASPLQSIIMMMTTMRIVMRVLFTME